MSGDRVGEPGQRQEGFYKCGIEKTVREMMSHVRAWIYVPSER